MRRVKESGARENSQRPGWNCRRLTPLLAALVVGGTTLAGCGDSGPTTVSVRGTVTFEGKPLDGGSITFQPIQVADGAPMRPAVGEIEPDGTYTLTTFKKGDGVPPGEYAVAITSLIGAPPASEWEEAPPKRESRIPLKYNQTDKSGLTASVPADSRGTLTIDFPLP